MVRLGLIGAGRWGRAYIRTIAALDGVVLAAVASRNPETVTLVAPGCALYRDWRELVAARDIDGVLVATPPALHAAMARAAIEAGLAVLVEKPLTLSLREARELMQVAAQRRATVLVDHTHLYHPAFEALKARVRDLGGLRALSSVAGNRGPYRADAPVLWDWGAHDVAMCLDLTGAKPAAVGARRLASQAAGAARGELIGLDLEFPGALRALIRIGNVIDRRRWFAAFCDNAVLVYDGVAAHRLAQYPPQAVGDELRGPATAIAVADELPLTRVVRAFADAVAARRCDLGSLELGVEVVEVLSRAEAALGAGN
ncbi:MAG: Gfo/Idh/MocA family oxidoreductase [Betaproteobacteria bacterium]|nr:Gfo/Idh/MocA family oxidoreductase [Betaproteobacteria bacterium]